MYKYTKMYHMCRDQYGLLVPEEDHIYEFHFRLDTMQALRIVDALQSQRKEFIDNVSEWCKASFDRPDAFSTLSIFMGEVCFRIKGRENAALFRLRFC